MVVVHGRVSHGVPTLPEAWCPLHQRSTGWQRPILEPGGGNRNWGLEKELQGFLSIMNGYTFWSFNIATDNADFFAGTLVNVRI